MPDRGPDAALVAELSKKSGLVWITFDGVTRPVWHQWVADAVCVVSGGGEQPLPGIADQSSVILGLRSKTTRQLVAEAEAHVENIAPDSALWVPVTDALKAGRLNLVDPDNAVARWAEESRVVRLVPTGAVWRGTAVDDRIGRSTPLLSANP